MSANIVLRSPALSMDERCLFFLIADAARQRPEVLITQEELARLGACSVRTVQRGIKALEAIGLLTVRRTGLMQPNIIVFESLTDELVHRLSLPPDKDEP